MKAVATRILTVVLALISAVLVFGLLSYAQITNVTNSTSTPIPGAGHDYIKMLSETVNPANGSVSVRIQTPTPSGRGISLPFAFGYDSNGVAHVATDGQGLTQWWDNASFLGQGGWSYSMPMVSNVEVVVMNSQQHVCDYVMDYVFQDPTGGRHSLRISDVTTPSSCNLVVPTPGNAPNGGDDYYQASLGNGGVTPSLLTISDADGTVYTFPPLDQDYIDPTRGSITSGVPMTIEDRNGNQISVSDFGGTVAGKFNVTDSLGRTLLSSSGLGTSGSTQTLTVSGLSPYSITWVTSNVSYSANAQLLYDAFGNCLAFQQVGRQNNVVTQITLPNQKTYQFTYDPVYGTVNKIT